MEEHVTISKKEPKSTSMNFALLKKQGLKHIEKLGSRIWTDYNTHDPGITIVEALCFAITDLGYRTSFDIKNILAEPQKSTAGPQFFTAKDVLTCNPVTENDFRKVIIDVPGVKNAWISVADESESVIGIDYENSLLLHGVGTNGKKLSLRGMYTIRLELDDDSAILDTGPIISAVKKRLHAVRNLCEDYYSIDVIGKEDVSLCADIDVTPGADINDVLAEIYFQVHQFISPVLQFYSLEEMLEKGKRSEDIFDGPLLAHGFIDGDELAKTVLPVELHVSDLYHLIMDIDGVKSIRHLYIRLHDSVGTIIRKEDWCLPLHAPDVKMQFRPDLSSITFYKGMIPLFANDEKVEDLYEIRLGSGKKPYIISKCNDFSVPEGTYHDLEDYISIQEEFPLTYGIGSAGLPDTSTSLRKAQAKQLQGYLLFFDQLLANYLAQLSKVKDLLSISYTEDNTYFANTLYDVPDVKCLFKDFDSSTQDWQTFTADQANGYISRLNTFLENDFTRWNRRNRFLDHLIARFGERFSDYAILMYDVYGNQVNPELVNDKETFLKDYPVISHDRGKAFNYKAWNSETDSADVWDTLNVSGFEARIARLLGIDNYSRRTLICDPLYTLQIHKITSGSNAGKWRLRLRDTDMAVILVGTHKYVQESNAQKNADLLKEQLYKTAAYSIKPVAGDMYRLFITNTSGNRIARSKQKFDSEPEARAFMLKLMALVCPEKECNTEGFHLVEHILLRPKSDEYQLLPVNIDSGSCPESTDPYSFRMSLVLPAWPERFRKWTFRKFIEDTIRAEAPAHIVVKICWVNCMQMHEFENAYKKWLELKADTPENATEQKELTDATNTLIKILFELRNVHNVAKLHDCNNSDEALILGYSTLGQL